MRKDRVVWVLAGCLAATIGLTLSGCHGGPQAPAVQTGGLAVKVTWPAPQSAQVEPQLIPERSTSINVKVAQEGIAVGQRLLVRPVSPPWMTETYFDTLPAGDAVLSATAHPEPDGSGVPQAEAQLNVVIPIGGDGYPQGGSPGDPVELVLGSTIVSVEVTPNPCNLKPGEIINLIAVAKDALRRNVLVPVGDAFDWSAREDGEGFASTAAAVQVPPVEVDQNGQMSALRIGEAVVEATEKESGVSGQTLVVVAPQPYAYVWQWSPEGATHSLTDVTVDAMANIYVSDGLFYQIYHLNPDGGVLGAYLAAGPVSGPFGIAYYYAGATAHVFATFTAENMVRRYLVGSLAPDLAWGGIGNQPGKFAMPAGITVAPSGVVYVVDSLNSRIQRFSLNGSYLGQWGNGGWDPGEFMDPADVAADGAGNVYVTDGNYRVQRFDAVGTFLGWWGKDDSGGVGWHEPGGTEQGAPGDELGAFREPSGIAVDADGSVYVADAARNCVQKFGPDGRPLSIFGATGNGPGQFMAPWGIDVDGAGNVYVVDAGNKRVQKFAPGAPER